MPVLDTGYYYKLLSPGIAGPDFAADVFDGGEKENVTFMAPIAGFTSQLWRFVRADDGTYRLSTLSRGPAFSAEAVDGGPEGLVRLTRGSSAAKAWMVEPVDAPGSFATLPGGSGLLRLVACVRLWTQMRGPGWTLDLAAGGGALMPTLAERGDGPGQAWMLARTDARAC